nr:uncharacterized protein At2g29880-like [Ipomoea trifida]
MGDTHQEKNKGKNKVNGNYALWATDESNELLQLMVDAIKNGWRDSSGGLSKLTVEKRILLALNEKLGCQRSYAQYQSRLKWFKNRFNNFSKLMRHSSGFGWDPITKRFTASNEVWEDYLKASSGDGSGGGAQQRRPETSGSLSFGVNRASAGDGGLDSSFSAPFLLPVMGYTGKAWSSE